MGLLTFEEKFCWCNSSREVGELFLSIAPYLLVVKVGALSMSLVFKGFAIVAPHISYCDPTQGPKHGCHYALHILFMFLTCF